MEKKGKFSPDMIVGNRRGKRRKIPRLGPPREKKTNFMADRYRPRGRGLPKSLKDWERESPVTKNFAREEWERRRTLPRTTPMGWMRQKIGREN